MLPKAPEGGMVECNEASGELEDCNWVFGGIQDVL